MSARPHPHPAALAFAALLLLSASFLSAGPDAIFLKMVATAIFLGGSVLAARAVRRARR